tara:strand:- start:3420 stop:3668 length:249 start_codon:yes stop_codon:yes gene_type:complete
MEELKNLTLTMVKSIVDKEEGVSVEIKESEKGPLLEIRVAKDDVGKVIGKQGRIASSLRVIVRAAAAKSGKKVLLNVFNKPA